MGLGSVCTDVDTKRFVVSLVALAGIAVGAGSAVASGQVETPAPQPATQPGSQPGSQPGTPAPSTVGAGLGDDVTLNAGQEVKIATKDFTVRFSRLAADSRCPANVQCIWAGDATVELLLSEPGRGESTRAELHTGLGLPRKEARFAAARVELLDVSRDGSTITVRVT